MFDGSAAPYATDAEPRPINTYGVTKLAGEREAQRILGDRVIILRIPILYGPIETIGAVLSSSLPPLPRSHPPQPDARIQTSRR